MMERTTGERVTYRCRLCRHQLFDSSCVLNTITNHHQGIVSTVPECLLDHSSTSEVAATTAYSAWNVPVANSVLSPARNLSLLAKGKAGQVGSSNGVLAPYGQVTAGPNPLWFINEDSTPPWVQKTLDKFQWKKGKLSCPKCHGRLGSFDFVTPYKPHVSSTEVSRIHIMRSRVDCESASPVVARIRPMPQNPQGISQSNETEEAFSVTHVEMGGAESVFEASEADSTIPYSSGFTPQTAHTSRQSLPETFFDEEIISNVSIPANYQSSASISESLKQRVVHVTHKTSSPSEPSQLASSSNCKVGRFPSCSAVHNNLTFRSGELDSVRRRISKGTTAVDKYVTNGIDGRHTNNIESTVHSSSRERSIAYVSGTNRVTNTNGSHFQNQFIVSQTSTISDNFSPHRYQSQRQIMPEESLWQRDTSNRSDEFGDDDDSEERMRLCPAQSSTNMTSSSTAVSHPRQADISANIVKNSPTFLNPLISSTFSSDRTRSQTPGSSVPSLYSPVLPSLEQSDRTRETLQTFHSVQGLPSRDSDDDADVVVADLQIENTSSTVSTKQRSPLEQRRERNRKKKERRKQRRYERWLERQTLGAEEESAIQDISAAGLYSLLGPRCAGSSLREVTTCSVCLDIYYQPHTCFPCEHIFCEPCLRQVARFHPVVTPCPLCRTTIRNVKLHDKLTSAVKQLFPRQFWNRHQMEQRTLSRSFPLPGKSNLPPWYRVGYQNNRNQVDFLASRRNPGYVHDWGMRYLQGVVWRVIASTAVLLIVSGISVGFLHFMFDFS